MKKTLIALAALAVSGTAFAQSTVTLSGAVGAEFSRGTAAGDAQLNNPDAGANNITVSGTEDLGGGLKANFYLQQRFDGVTGANGNSALSTDPGLPRGLQNVFVGLSGGFGAVQIGRFLTAPSAGYDAFAQYGNVTTDYANAGAVGARNDRTVQYSTPSFSGFSATVATTNDNANLGDEYQYIRATYAAGPLSVSIANQTSANISTTASAAKGTDVGVSYDFGMAKVMVLNGKATAAVTGAETSNTTVGIRVPMGAVTIKAAVRSGDSANASAVGVDYALSKRTGVFADFGNVDGAAQTAMRVGVKHSF